MDWLQDDRVALSQYSMSVELPDRRRKPHGKLWRHWKKGGWKGEGGGEEGGGIFPGAHGTSQTIHVQVAFEAPTDMLQVQQRVAACLQACEGMLLTHGGRSEIREALLGFSRVGAGSHSVGGGKLGLCTR